MVQNHTVKIDNLEFYAQQVKVPKPYERNEWTEMKIESGRPRWYKGAMGLRTINFSVTLYGDVPTLIEWLRPISNKVVQFSSVYIGSFKATVNQSHDYEDGVPNTLKVNFEVQEV